MGERSRPLRTRGILVSKHCQTVLEGHDSGAANHIRVPELVFESALQRPGDERQTA